MPSGGGGPGGRRLSGRSGFRGAGRPAGQDRRHRGGAERLRDTLSELDSLKDDADAYLEAVNGELEGVQADITRLSRQMEETKAAIAQAETELAGAKESEKTQYENMKLRIKYMYEKGDTFFLELLFESASLSEFLSQAEYISKISEYDRNMLTAYQETKQLIADKTEELSEAYAAWRPRWPRHRPR